jgi:hypothetical protein
MKYRIILLILIVLPIILVSAQNVVVDTQPTTHRFNLFERLQTTDSLSGGVVNFFQDKRIERIFTGRATVHNSTQKVAGYRVQVFSSNAQRTAKDEAFNIEQELKQLFPQYAVYVNYSSPFWKVRIGDFASYATAQEFRNELVGKFTAYKAETYVVKDQINK